MYLPSDWGKKREISHDSQAGDMAQRVKTTVCQTHMVEGENPHMNTHDKQTNT